MADRFTQRSRRSMIALMGFAVTLTIAFTTVIARAAETPTRDSAAPTTESRVVTIANMQFEPSELIVKRGTRIVWVNKDFVPHTVTAISKRFDSPTIAADASWSYVADEPGTYPYECAFHVTMKGKLVVRE